MLAATVLAATALAATLGLGLAACGSGAHTATAGPPALTRPVTGSSSPSSPPSSSPGSTAGPAASATNQAPTVVADCGAGAFQPARIVVTCGSPTVVATEIHWSTWSATQAAGTSVVEVNLCKPTCAGSGDRPFPARVVLSKPVQTRSGPRFSLLTAIWTGTPPYGRTSNAYPLPTTVP